MCIHPAGCVNFVRQCACVCNAHDALLFLSCMEGRQRGGGGHESRNFLFLAKRGMCVCPY